MSYTTNNVLFVFYYTYLLYTNRGSKGFLILIFNCWVRNDQSKCMALFIKQIRTNYCNLQTLCSQIKISARVTLNKDHFQYTNIIVNERLLLRLRKRYDFTQTAPIYTNVKLWGCEAQSFLDQI